MPISIYNGILNYKDNSGNFTPLSLATDMSIQEMLTTLQGVIDDIIPNEDTVSNILNTTVRVIEDQGFTNEQKAIGRNNISAASQEDVSHLEYYNSSDILHKIVLEKPTSEYTNGEITRNGITFTLSSNKKSCTVSGTLTAASSWISLYYSTSTVPSMIIPEKEYYVKIETTDSRLGLYLTFFFNNTTANRQTIFCRSDTTVIIPKDITGLAIQLLVSGTQNATINAAINRYDILDKISISDLQKNVDLGKNSTDNKPAGLTYFTYANNYPGTTDLIKPEDLPINSYVFISGNKLDLTSAFGEVAKVDHSYIIFCICNLWNTAIRTYYLIGRGGEGFYSGNSSDGGNTITWQNTGIAINTSLIDSSTQNPIDDPQTTGSSLTLQKALYLSKIYNENYAAGLTYFNHANYSASDPITPQNLPFNSYTYVAGSKLANFFNGIDNNHYYWIGCMVELWSGEKRFYIVIDTTTNEFIYGIGTYNNSAISIKWINLSSKIDEALENSIELKVLVIGNSFGQDAVNYAPYILNNMNTRVKLILGNTYISSGNFQNYVNVFDANYNVDIYSKYSYNNEKWINTSNKNFKEVLTDEKWDLVIFQQGGAQSNFDDGITLIDKIVPYISANNGKGVRLGYLLPQVAIGTSISSTYNYNVLINSAEYFLNKAPIDFVIPCGTAVECARGTTLDSLGDSTNHHLAYDNITGHLQEGIPRLIVGYTTALKLLEAAGIMYNGIMGDAFRPTGTWLSAHDMINARGLSTGITEANCLLAQKCVMAAIKKPFEVSTIY